MFPRLAALASVLLAGCGGPELWLVVTREPTEMGLSVTACAADGTECVDGSLAEVFPPGDTALTRTVGLELQRGDLETFSLKLQSNGLGRARCDRLVVPVEPRGRDITVRLDGASPPGPPEVDCGEAHCTLAACL